MVFIHSLLEKGFLDYRLFGSLGEEKSLSIFIYCLRKNKSPLELEVELCMTMVLNLFIFYGAREFVLELGESYLIIIRGCSYINGFYFWFKW
jgi:hypothetical protein